MDYTNQTNTEVVVRGSRIDGGRSTASLFGRLIRMIRAIRDSILRALSVVSLGHFCLPRISNGEILVYFVLQSAGIVVMTKAIDPFLTDVEAAAPFAAENGELTVFPGAAGRSVPDFQGNALLLGGAAIVMENFAAGGIGASENQLGHLHRESALSSDQGKRYGELTLGQIEWSSFL